MALEGASPMRDTAEKTYLTVSDAARELQVNPSTIWRWIESGKLPAYRLGERTIRIRKQDLESLLKPVRPKDSRTTKPKWARPISDDEIARRKELFDRIVENRKERIIAPLTTADLVHQARKEAGVEE
jgi:excisionase family DNA binding protein